MMWYGDGPVWMWMFGLPMMLLLVVAVVIAVNAYLGGGRRSSDEFSPDHGRHARELLDERYAAGEMTTEEYDERRRTLDNRR